MANNNIGLYEEKGNTLIESSEAICEMFGKEVARYETIIDNLQSRGWIGPSNNKFVNGSNNYKTNLNEINKQLEEFKTELTNAIKAAIASFNG